MGGVDVSGAQTGQTMSAPRWLVVSQHAPLWAVWMVINVGDEACMTWVV
jgi:hypothetical protein